MLNTIPETCKKLKKGRTYVYGLINTGQLAAIKSGRNTLVTDRAIESYIASLPSYRPQQAKS